MLYECTLKTTNREKEEKNGTYPLFPWCEKSGSRDQAQLLAPHWVGASVMNFDQRDIVKISRKCFFSCISFTYLWQQPHTSVCSSLAPTPALSLLSWLKLVHKGLTAAPPHWNVSKLKRHLLSLFPVALIVLLYPFLADQYITLSLNISIFSNHSFVFYFNFFLKKCIYLWFSYLKTVKIQYCHSI